MSHSQRTGRYDLSVDMAAGETPTGSASSGRSKGPGRSSSCAISRTAGSTSSPHQPQRAHRVLVRHRAVAVPEADAAGAQVLEHMANLRQHRLGACRK